MECGEEVEVEVETTGTAVGVPNGTATDLVLEDTGVATFWAPFVETDDETADDCVWLFRGDGDEDIGSTTLDATLLLVGVLERGSASASTDADTFEFEFEDPDAVVSDTSTTIASVTTASDPFTSASYSVGDDIRANDEWTRVECWRRCSFCFFPNARVD